MAASSVPIDVALVVATHPAFRLRCICRTRPHRLRITPPDGEPRDERLCTVCAAQLAALSYRVVLTG